MQWITIATPPFGSIEQFDMVHAAGTAQLGGEPDALEARYVGTADGKLRVVTLWESKAHADRFFAETLGPALARALGPRTGRCPRGHRVRRGTQLRPRAGRLRPGRRTVRTARPAHPSMG